MKKRYYVFSLLLLVLSGVLAWSTWIYFITTPMAFNKTLKESTRIYDRDGILLDELHGEEHRIIVASNEIDDDIKAAVIAIEDANFYKHNGVSIRGVGRAVTKAAKDSIKAKELSINEGASTINMQLAKNLNGSVQDRTVTNKISETIQALKLDRTYSKDEILTKYLNVIYWGNNTYGVQTATQTYFGKDADNVEVHEAAMLAAMIQNPSKYNPYITNEEVKEASYQNLKERQKQVLFNLSYSYSECITPTEENSISKESYKTCLEEWSLSQWNEPLLLTGKTTWKNPTGVAGYIVDLAVNEIIKERLVKVSSLKDLEDKGLGLKIYSTIRLEDQIIAGNVVDRRRGGKGGAEIATTGVEPSTGKVLFSIGGLDYNTSKINRTTAFGGLEGRQAGSSMKPAVYFTAIEDFGWEPSDTILDEEYCPVKANRWTKEYCPKNYGGTFSGIDTLTNHLAKSRNIPAVKLGQYVGNRNVIRNMRKVGYTTKLDNVPSFPLGANNVILSEHVSGLYGTFANDGIYNPNTSLERIENTKGKTLYEYTSKSKRVFDSRGVSQINEILKYAATNGTGVMANTIPNVHAKTGTTDREADTWIMTYVPGKISMGVWIGHDDYNKKMYGASSYSWNGPIAGEILLNLRNNGSI